VLAIENGGRRLPLTSELGYTREQAEAIQRLKHAKDDYQRLGLHYDASRYVVTDLLSTLTADAGVMFFSVYLSVYPHDISKTDAAPITTLDTEMFHHESLKPIYFGIRRSENVHKSTSIAIFKRCLKTFLFEQITHSAH